VLANKAVTEYYDTIEDRRVMSAVEPGYLKKILPSGPPEEGEAWSDIQRDIDTKILPGLTHWYVTPLRFGHVGTNKSF
jgi:aromatic-L-amino-acid/L-tryptophan decarboxylase